MKSTFRPLQCKQIIVSKFYNQYQLILHENVSTKAERKIKECYKTLNLPNNSKQEAVKQAFLDLAKRYHPDSGSQEASIEKFVEIENAFRTLTQHNTGKTNTEEVEKVVFDIRHTAPQHRQYLSFEGIGHGTPFQRQKQWVKARAQKAAENVMEHRVSKSLADEKSIMKKGQYGKKHDIKTKYGFDRLVEDLIQESISKGEFENLSGKGKPLRDQNTNPYVDFTTHKLNEVLINNGFTPEWITMNKEISQDIDLLVQELKDERMVLGPYPMSPQDLAKWTRICQAYKELSESINKKINKYNLIVPLMNKQRFHVEFDKISEDILRNGIHSVIKEEKIKKVDVSNDEKYVVSNNQGDDFIGLFFKALGEVFGSSDEVKNKKAKN